MKSVLQKEKKCYVCENTHDLHEHHCLYGTSNRKNAERRGLKIYLCGRHHNLSNEGIHFNKELDIHVKQMAQRYYEEHYGTRDDFRREFGKSYL